MDFQDINNLIKGLPKVYHFIVSGILIGMMAHLVLSFKMNYKYKPKIFNTIWLVCYFIIVSLFFGKFGHPGYTMLDVFLPMYFIFYFQSLLFLTLDFSIEDCKLKSIFQI